MKDMHPDPRYQLGSSDDYAKLIRDSVAGVPGAMETVKYYQALARGGVSQADDYRIRLSQAAADGHKGAEAVLYNLPPGEKWVTPSEQLEVTVSGKDARRLAELIATSEVPVLVNGTEVARIGQQPSEPDMHFTSTTRIGDEVRDRYLTHLGAMFSGGHIDQAEYEARSDRAVKAATREELDFLIHDLPAIPRRQEEPVVTSRKKPPSSTALYCWIAGWSAFALFSNPLLGGPWIFCLIMAAVFSTLFIVSVVKRMRMR
jgi:hypothetical protein